jgi:hypothetical protein
MREETVRVTHVVSHFIGDDIGQDVEEWLRGNERFK